MKTNYLKSFKLNGYQKINLFSQKDIEKIILQIFSKIKKISKNKDGLINAGQLKFYHQKVIEKKIHEKCVKNKTRYVIFNNQMLKKIRNNKYLNSIIKNFWGSAAFRIRWDLLNSKKLITNTVGFRIVRPHNSNKKAEDAGGEHTDMYFGDKRNNSFRALLIIWCPLIGFSEKYTLRIAPKSHLINHPVNEIKKQQKFLSPVMNYKYIKKFKFIRPRLRVGQAILFHPNLIHGGSINKGNLTRISIDLRIHNLSLKS